MVIVGITKDDLSKSSAYPYVTCGLITKVNTVLCVQYCKCIHSRCAEVNRVNRVFKQGCLQEISKRQWIV